MFFLKVRLNLDILSSSWFMGKLLLPKVGIFGMLPIWGSLGGLKLGLISEKFEFLGLSLMRVVSRTKFTIFYFSLSTN